MKIAIFLLNILGIFTRGWALSVLWGWIMVPTFQLPPILVWQAWGILVIFSFLLMPLLIANVDVSQLSIDRLAESLTMNIIMPPLTLAITWVILRLFGV